MKFVKIVGTVKEKIGSVCGENSKFFSKFPKKNCTILLYMPLNSCVNFCKSKV